MSGLSTCGGFCVGTLCYRLYMLKWGGYGAFALAFGVVLLHFASPAQGDPAQVVASVESQITAGADALVHGTQKGNAFLAAAAAHTNDPLTLEPRTKTAACAVAGALPDPGCTPGAVFREATPATICVKGYTKSVRNVSVTTKKKVYAEYGITYPQPTGSYEADHLIPLELGGSNDMANLFPESADPKPGFHEKDLVENYLNQAVCAGDLSLAYAQQVIATNWLEVWNALSPQEISLLKSQY